MMHCVCFSAYRHQTFTYCNIYLTFSYSCSSCGLYWQYHYKWPLETRTNSRHVIDQTSYKSDSTQTSLPLPIIACISNGKEPCIFFYVTPSRMHTLIALSNTLDKYCSQGISKSVCSTSNYKLGGVILSIRYFRWLTRFSKSWKQGLAGKYQVHSRQTSPYLWRFVCVINVTILSWYNYLAGCD